MLRPTLKLAPVSAAPTVGQRSRSHCENMLSHADLPSWAPPATERTQMGAGAVASAWSAAEWTLSVWLIASMLTKGIAPFASAGASRCSFGSRSAGGWYNGASVAGAPACCDDRCCSRESAEGGGGRGAVRSSARDFGEARGKMTISKPRGEEDGLAPISSDGQKQPRPLTAGLLRSVRSPCTVTVSCHDNRSAKWPSRVNTSPLSATKGLLQSSSLFFHRPFHMVASSSRAERGRPFPCTLWNGRPLRREGEVFTRLPNGPQMLTEYI